jgi:succinate dehydrogenase / fumarate reductase flavoprotein subunit
LSKSTKETTKIRIFADYGLSDGKMMFDAKIPSGELSEKWEKQKFEYSLVNPPNRRKMRILIIGSGLAGASAAASLGELGYQVDVFTFSDSTRRAHSVAAQGGINAAKNYKNDGDSVRRLFYDTVKGGDYRAREANVYRLAQMSNNIIDQSVAQGVPFARDYGGLLDNRSFGGAQLERTFFARGQTGQQLLIGAYSSLSRQAKTGTVQIHTRREMTELVLNKDGRAVGIVVRNMITGELERHAGDAVVIASGGYGNVFYLSTNAKTCNSAAAMAAFKKGAGFANPCFTQIHPTCIPVSGDHQSKLTLMSESLRNDGRVWVPAKIGDKRNPNDIPESERHYVLESRYPAFGNLTPRDIASRAIKLVCDKGMGVSADGNGVYLDFKHAIERLGKDKIEERYGNLFEMYEKITGKNPYGYPMMIYPASHYTMGGLWVDYHLMSNIEGLFVIGEANFSDHGANRLGASALMQGLADGYFVLPYSLPNYLANAGLSGAKTNDDCFKTAENDTASTIKKIVENKGDKSPEKLHRKLGKIMWDGCGMARTADGIKNAQKELEKLEQEFESDIHITGNNEDLNPTLEHAMRLREFIQTSKILAADALSREESCGSHFREEYQTQDNEAMRNDDEFAHVAIWTKNGKSFDRHKEELKFDEVKLSTRSYK